MESSAESCCIPPGFRFHPTEEELVGYYLKKKVAYQEIDLDVIKDIDLYRIEPWDLQERCRIGYEEQREWYFFSHKDKKYPTGRRTNRATMTGFWKATGRDKAVYDKAGLIGMRKTLVFYVGRAPNGQKTDWIMHEYRLESEDNGPPQEEGWVVCRAFMKRSNSQYKSTDDRWDANLYYQKQSHMDSVTHTSKMPQTLLCKQEAELTDNHLNHLHSDPHVELPQLERPSPPLMKNSNLVPISSENKVKETSLTNKLCVEKVTDWRALDKLVASQLSQEDDGYDISERNPACMSLEQNSDVGLLLWQTSIEEESAVKKGFLSSVCDCDIGICIFGS